MNSVHVCSFSRLLSLLNFRCCEAHLNRMLSGCVTLCFFSAAQHISHIDRYGGRRKKKTKKRKQGKTLATAFHEEQKN